MRRHGAPALSQEICLDVAEHAVNAGRDEITREDIEESVHTFLLNSQARLTQRYMTAIETTGPKRYRKQVWVRGGLVQKTGLSAWR